MSKTKGASTNKKVTTIAEVVNTYDDITFGPSAYGHLNDDQIFYSELKEQYENGSIPLHEVDKAQTTMTLNQMKDELKWCLNNIIRVNQEHLLAEIIYLLKKEFVSGPEQDIQTAAIRMRAGREGRFEMTLVMNMDFFFGECVTRAQRTAILYHEVYHVLFKHLTLRRAEKQTVLWNIAQDLAINSLVCDYQKQDAGNNWKVDLTMFPGACSTNVVFDLEDPNLNRTDVEAEIRKEMEAYAKETGREVPEAKIQKTIESAMKMRRRVACRSGCFPLVGAFKDIPPNLSSEEYYEILRDPDGPVKWQDISSMIDLIMSQHDWFADVDSDDLGDMPEGATEEFRRFYEAVKSRVRDHLSKKGRGHGSSAIDELLEKLYVARPNWASILAKHIASSRKNLTQTWVRRNRRGVKGMPAIQHDCVHNVRIYVDQSGSMSDEDVAKMYGRIQPLLKSADVTVYHFDYGVDENSKHQVRYSRDLKPIRTRSGGTDFDSVFDHLGNGKERVDVAVIMTDMGAPPPKKSNRKVVFMYSEDMNWIGDVPSFKKLKHKVIKLPA